MNTPDLLRLAAAAATLLTAAACAYLLLLTLLSRRLRVPRAVPPGLRLAVVVPAHNEAGGIAHTVRNLLAMDWPRELLRVIVVADNCTDDTAERAAAAGAQVLERQDTVRHGKGHALKHAFNHLLAVDWADAALVIDADSEADPGLPRAIAARIAVGAVAVQAHYTALNPGASWRTRLMCIAMSAFHTVRSRARENLGLSCGIRGNGWCVTLPLLQQQPYDAYSVVEDVEYGARLGLAGYRVEYFEEACVRAEMVSRAAHAAPQRRRWELGRRQLRRELTPPLLRAAMRGDRVCFDLALDLLVPPLSQLALAALGCTVAAALLDMSWALVLSAFSVLALVLYVGRGWQLSGMGRAGALDLLRAPYFIAWKIAVLIWHASTGWTRTQREQRP